MKDAPFTLVVDPDEKVVMLDAARKLRAIGLPASGTFLSAAEELMRRGMEVTHDNLARALHEPE